MLVGRFVPILVVARGRRLAGRQEGRPGRPGHVRTDTPTFVVLLIGVIVLVGALTFFPALLLGPIVQSLTDEAVLMMRRDLTSLAARGRRASRSLLGLAYPLAMTGVAQVALPGQGGRLPGDASTARSSARS